MARSRRKTSGGRSSGSTLFGILVGLILGLAAAVAVALFVTKVPMPFSDKFSREPAKVLLPDARDAPDPNLGLFGKGGAAGTQPNGPTDTTIKSGGNEPKETLDQLLANLNATGATPATPAPAAAKPVPGTEAPAGAAKPAAQPAAPATAASAGNSQATYYLQAGAFRSESDAQAMQARILLLGLPVTIQKATVNGENINRVRVGPFKGIDDMNRSRTKLGEEKITTSVVRP